MPLVALCVRDQLECVELCLGTDDEPAENWWVRTEGQTNMCKVVRPPDYEVMYEVFFRQLEETLCLEVLGLRRNLLTQVIKELMGKTLCCTWYRQIRKNWSEMWRAGASLAACSEHEVAELRILREGSKANSRMTTLKVRRTDFDLFRNLLRKIPWNTILKRRGV